MPEMDTLMLADTLQRSGPVISSVMEADIAVDASLSGNETREAARET